MAVRLRRAEQVERNREAVLEAARQVFIQRGYAGASLEAIAEVAGFSKGVVYSQFGSKPDLFFALLERRITERAAQNDRVVAQFVGAEALHELIRASHLDAAVDSGWRYVLTEFRALAMRDPELNRRYAEAHSHAVESLASVLGRVYQGTGLRPPLPPIPRRVFPECSRPAFRARRQPECFARQRSCPVDAACGRLGYLSRAAVMTIRASSTAWQRFRDDVRMATLAGASEQIARLTWNSEQIAQAQRDGLRRLLRHAAEYSPFHRGRLAGIDLMAVDPADLSALPVMTKTAMMDELDDVFTDRRLGRADVEAALAATGAEAVPILDDYVALASGGCSGRRGLFVFDRQATTLFFAALTGPR